jgi:hypothetical protein
LTRRPPHGALAELDISTTLVTDSAVFAVMTAANKVIIGTPPLPRPPHPGGSSEVLLALFSPREALREARDNVVATSFFSVVAQYPS